MSPISGRIGRIFQRKDLNDRTPPKALYDDLESAHESITRKTSSTRSREYSRVYQSDENMRLSILTPAHLSGLNPTAKERVRSIALAFDPQSSPALMQDQTYAKIGRATTQSLKSEMLAYQHNGHSAPSTRPSSGIDEPSQWQTVMSEIGWEDMSDQDPGIQCPLPIAQRLPRYQKPSDASSFYKSDLQSFSHRLQITGSDTVDEIIHRYLPNTSGANRRETIGYKSEAHQPTKPTSTGADLFGHERLENLNQFAWSPCSSETDPHESNRVLEVSSHDGLHDMLPLSAMDTGERASINRDRPYGDTHKALQLATELYSNTKNAPHGGRDFHSSIESSKLAGDLTFLKSHQSKAAEAYPDRETNRFSGFISDGVSSRPMSQAELEDSLGSFVRSALRQSDLTNASGRLDRITNQDADGNVVPHAAIAALGQRVEDVVTDVETSTTPGSFYQRAQSDDRHDLANALPETSIFHARKKTPPGLFGRFAFGPFKNSREQERLSLTRKNSRLVQAAAAAGVREYGRLGRAMAGSPEQYRETNRGDCNDTPAAMSPFILSKKISGNVSDVKGFREEPYEPSVASENISLIRDDAFRHSVHPRYNHSWFLIKDQVTGSMAMIPNHISQENYRMPVQNSIHPVYKTSGLESRQQYHHPKPLPKTHQRPISSSPRMDPSGIALYDRAHDQPLTTQEKRMNRDLTTSDFSRSSTNSDGSYDKNNAAGLSCSISRAGSPSGGDIDPPFQQTTRRQASSTWLSTVSEGQSGTPYLPDRISSFAKTTVTGRNGNLTGTPDGTGARETGSSLADGSSPGGGLSLSPRLDFSSPAMPQSPPEIEAHTPRLGDDSALYAYHRQLGSAGPPTSSKTRGKGDFFDTSRPPVKKNIFGEMLSGKKSPSQELFAKGLQTEDPSPENINPQDRLELEDQSQYNNGMVQRPTIKCFDFGGKTEVKWQDYLPLQVPRRESLEVHELYKIERQGEASLIVQGQREDGFRDQLPELIGLTKETEFLDPGDRKTKSFDRLGVGSQSRTPSPLLRHAISPDDPPRLYDNICKPSAATQARHKRYSRLWALLCIFIPFLGPIYGHGYLDKIMLWHSAGGITGFRRQEKLFVLVYSYITFAAVLVALAITMVIVSK